MPPVELLSKPNCVQCVATHRALDNLGIPYVEVDMTQNPDALDKAISMGHRSAPVVIAGEESWSGFRMDKIEELASRYVA